MDSELRRALADCLSDMERGAGVEDCLKRNPGLAAELRPHLEASYAMSRVPLAQPSASALDRGRQTMRAVLSSPPAGFSLLTTARLAPAWATVAAAVVAVVVLLGGVAGASAALGGPDPAGDVLSAVGVTGGEGGISNSSASERGLACANPNAFEGAANSEDKGQNAGDAHESGVDGDDVPNDTVDADGEGDEDDEDEDCADGDDLVAEDGCEDANRGHGNDADRDDEDNPGQGEGGDGASDGDSDGETDCPEDTATIDECGDENRGHGNDADGFDEDNPGQGQERDEASPGDECLSVDEVEDPDSDENRGHGNDADHDDEDNPGQGQGNHGADDGGAGNDNANGQDNPSSNGNGGEKVKD